MTRRRKRAAVEPALVPEARPLGDPPPPPPLPARRRRPYPWRFAATVAIVFWIAAALQPKWYRATAVAVVVPASGGMTAGEVLRSLDTLGQPIVVDTVAALASAPLTLRTAHASPAERVESDVVPSTTVFTVTVDARDPLRAATVANAIVSTVAARTPAVLPMFAVRAVSAATTPARPALPRMPRAITAGAAAGAIAGALAMSLAARRQPSASA